MITPRNLALNELLALTRGAVDDSINTGRPVFGDELRAELELRTELLRELIPVILDAMRGCAPDLQDRALRMLRGR